MTAESPSTTDRLAEIRARLDAVGHTTWGATYDDYDEDKGSHWKLHFGNGRTADLPGGYDEWHPVLDLVCNAPEDLALLLKRRTLLERAYEDAKDLRDKYERRVIEWREAAEQARAESASLRARLDTAEERLVWTEQECDDLAIQRNHLKNRLEDLGVMVDDED